MTEPSFAELEAGRTGCMRSSAGLRAASVHFLAAEWGDRASHEARLVPT
jgi:hypothetical protein